MVAFRVLSRTNLADPYRHSSPNSWPFNLLQPLCSLFAAPVLCFQQLAASFPKTPGVGGTPTLPRRASLPPSYAPRGASIPCGLTRLRILPVTTEVYPANTLSLSSVPPWQSIYCPFVFILLQNPFPANPLFSHLCKTPGGVGGASVQLRTSNL